ncbi:hypothetical protein QR680_016467 [Steinernema hermaphroditum]|uniref:mitogen-activated protein kinase kinase n=1 Tax=Steinernema hermaphroditum TaxID=289476 RepID=A0AA39HDS1_9BILA|nr:hypothetical protein QR680_016467 [Steinernema hermaphroditum]
MTRELLNLDGFDSSSGADARDSFPPVRGEDWETRIQAFKDNSGNVHFEDGTKDDGVRVADICRSAKLGSGSFGQVWKATVKGHTLAVKFCNPIIKDFKPEQKWAKHTAKAMEIDSARGPRCANILPCYGYIIGENYSVILFLQFMTTSLGKILERSGTIPDLVVGKFASDVSAGMYHLRHTFKVLHRDIKPDNMLIDKRTGVVKLCDFGLAGKVNDLSQITSAPTTAKYLAPEIGTRSVDGKKSEWTTQTDVYSFGISMYELIKGVLPVDNRPIYLKEPLNLHLTPNDSPNLHTLVNDCLLPDKDAEKLRPNIKNLDHHPVIRRFRVEEINVVTWLSKTLTEHPELDSDGL